MSITFTPEQIASIGERVKAGESSEAIAKTFGCDRKVILRLARKHSLGPWTSQTNQPQQTHRPPPADFAERTAEMSDSALAKLYRCNGSAPARWRRELGLPSRSMQGGGSNKILMPEGFTEFAPGKTIEEIAKHYGFGHDTARRLRVEAGIHAVLTGRPGQRRNSARPAHLVRNAYMSTPVDRFTRDGSRAGLAADFLRKFGPVSKCNDLGVPDIAGKRWRRGSKVLTDAMLIERAEGLGWDCDGWKQVKAA